MDLSYFARKGKFADKRKIFLFRRNFGRKLGKGAQGERESTYSKSYTPLVSGRGGIVGKESQMKSMAGGLDLAGMGLPSGLKLPF